MVSIVNIKKIKYYFVYKIGLHKIQISKQKNKDVINEIKTLLPGGYKVTKRRRAICINDGSTNHLKKYLLRPNTSDKCVFVQVFINKEYFPMIEIVQNSEINLPIKRIVDAGSNIGLTSFYFSNYFPEALILSIEPDIENCAHQKKNIKLNRLNKSVILIEGALWKNNIDNLTISNNFRDGESWSKSVVPGKSFKNNKYVRPFTLRDILGLFGDKEPIDILKMDIEGAEAELFKNNDFIKVLTTSVKYLCLEIHDELNIRQDIYAIFSKIGFSFEEHGETCFCINKSFK
jgi:FkbM family methyltransferase